MDEKENEITGDWMSHMNIDGDEVWNVDKYNIEPHTPVANPIPSDPRYREDVIWLRNDNKDFALVLATFNSTFKPYLFAARRVEVGVLEIARHDIDAVEGCDREREPDTVAGYDARVCDA